MLTRRSAVIGLAATAAPTAVLAQTADDAKQVEDALLALVFGSSVDIPSALAFLTAVSYTHLTLPTIYSV